MLAMLAAVMLAAAPQHDTVFTAEGGRIIGTVVEESAQSVSVQMPDGTFRRLPRHDVVRIEYSDGSVSSRPSGSPPAAAAPQGQPPPPPAATPPPPAYAPPPPPSYYPPPYYGRPVQRVPPPQWAPPASTGPISPFFLNLGIGGMFFGGNVEPGYSANGTFGAQMDLNFEGGLRLNPHLGLGLYADLGVGGPGSDLRSTCDASGGDCTSTTSRVGVFLRHTFTPYAHATPWVSIGTGYSHGSVDWSAGPYDSQNVLEYSGWEIARLMGGYDIRSSPVLGFGLYAGVGFTRYTDYRDANVGSVGLPRPTVNTMFEAGVRLTLFP
jgi:hypothetical protein